MGGSSRRCLEQHLLQLPGVGVRGEKQYKVSSGCAETMLLERDLALISQGPTLRCYHIMFCCINPRARFSTAESCWPGTCTWPVLRLRTARTRPPTPMSQSIHVDTCLLVLEMALALSLALALHWHSQQRGVWCRSGSGSARCPTSRLLVSGGCSWLDSGAWVVLFSRPYHPMPLKISSHCRNVEPTEDAGRVSASVSDCG